MNRSIVITIFLFFVIGAAHAQVSDQQIVNNAFPVTLGDGDGVRFSRFIAVDINRNGQPLLVAVYTNDAGGAIRVLDRAGQVLAAPALQGIWPCICVCTKPKGFCSGTYWCGPQRHVR